MPLGAATHLRDRARLNHEGNMPDVASIYRPGTPIQTPDFGTETTYTLLDAVPANYWTVTGAEARVLERMDVRAEATVSVPALTDVTEHDQIVYEVAETGVIHHFNVQFVFDRSRGLALRVAVTEFKFDPLA